MPRHVWVMKRWAYLTLVMPWPVYAEVSDKMSSQAGLYGSGLLVGLLLFVLLRVSRRWNWLAWPLVGLFCLSVIDTIGDAHIRSAVVQEQGWAYMVAEVGSAVLVLLGTLWGNAWAAHSQRKLECAAPSSAK